MYFRSLTSVTWVYCICHQVYCRGHDVLQELPSVTWVYCICHQVCCRGHDVHALQEPHFNQFRVLHILSCKSGASLGVLYLPAGVLHMPSCTSEASLGALYLPTGVLHMPSSNTRSSTGVYYICHQLHCGGHDALQEPHFSHLGVLHLPSSVSRGHDVYVLQEPHFSHLGILHLPSSVLQRLWCACTSEASLQSLGCTTYSIM